MDDLPPPNTTRWVIRRKAAVVVAVGGDRTNDCSMRLFSRFCEDLGRGQKDCSLIAIFVREIGLLRLHNSKRGHSRLIVALTHNCGPTASKNMTDIPCAKNTQRIILLIE
jgi:hypothetical protein